MNKQKYFVLILFFYLLIPSLLFALPESPEAVNGTATFDYSDLSTLNITASDHSIIHYNAFNIAQNETVNFTLPSIDSISLNRVTGPEASSILGRLFANGTILFINPQGIFFGPQSTVQVGGLIASTRDITNQDFLRGTYKFGKDQSGPYSSITNEGLIKTREGGFAALIGSAVSNEGTVIAPLGTVSLASGDVVTVGINQNNTLSIAIDEKTSK